MTEQPQGTALDANDVIDELVAHIGRLSKEAAILRVQLKMFTSPTHQIGADPESETQPQ